MISGSFAHDFGEKSFITPCIQSCFMAQSVVNLYNVLFSGTHDCLLTSGLNIQSLPWILAR